ncbi:hypothetical protein [Robertkochia solimangrovi]|uniref:hypothetical protein n=1 Tax=Robertkochia solimangrovi TaxID=2213046 RepID=UPI00117DF20C|nr:hypothetical protein [Robertkochia solimangrovi]TRZ42165.1 hypothetical protein DMZ48_14120 [Robertkochia solimangrovi]
MKFLIKIVLIAVVLFVVAIIAFIVAFGDHTNRTNFRIYSLDKKQCITVITQGETRYIINGEHNSVPKTDYIKIDKSGIDPIGDEIGICWKNENYEWELVNHQSKILEVKLDTLKYKFNTSWEKDKYGIPNSKKYHQPNCGTIDLLNMKVYNEPILLEN